MQTLSLAVRLKDNYELNALAQNNKHLLNPWIGIHNKIVIYRVATETFKQEEQEPPREAMFLSPLVVLAFPSSTPPQSFS